METKKTITCRIIEPKKCKLEALKTEYDKVQRYIKGEDVDTYSATVQAMDKYTDFGCPRRRWYPGFTMPVLAPTTVLALVVYYKKRW